MPHPTETSALSQSVSELDAFFRTLSASTTSALMLDYDGTLAPFQVDRFRAYPYPGVLPLLEKIQQTGNTRIIMITGRPIHEVQDLLTPLSGIEIWGAHGMEHLLPDGTRRQVPIVPELTAILQQAQQILKQSSPEEQMEIKPGGVVLHWRGLPADTVRTLHAQTLKDWAPLAQHPDIKLLDFEGGIELRVLRPDKGDVVGAILKSLDPTNSVAFLGDDLTDEDGFRILSDRGLPILVREEYRETSARAWIKPPEELLRFLEQWLLRTTASTNPADPLH
jgi:trehalose 6-phosphate phosphatase